MMTRVLPAVLLSILFIYSGCRKEDASPDSENIDPDDCGQPVSLRIAGMVDAHYIVIYKDQPLSGRGITPGDIGRISTEVLQRNQISRQALIESFSGGGGGFIASLSDDEVARLQKDENISAIEQDRVISLGTCFTVAAPRLITWNVHRTGFGNGIGKRVWVIDTGVDSDHPDLEVDTRLSKSFVSGDISIEDSNGHGTHVAGIIAARNNAIGVLGIASGATVVALKVLDKEGQGLLSNIIKALAYVNMNASPGEVVNMSVGDEKGGSATLDLQVRNTAAKGIFISIAAGNDSEPANKFSPGRTNAENVYTVSAIDSLDRFANFSNYGNDVVDYAAPGVRILSTFTKGRYAYMSGTSMAAPHVAGLLLLKGKNLITSGFAVNDPDGTPDPIAHY